MAENVITIPSSAEGQILLEYLISCGYQLNADCGGNGTCGKCRVKVVSGRFAEVGSNGSFAPDDRGYILSCRAVCTNEGAVIEIPEFYGTGLTSYETRRTKSEALQSVAELQDGFGLALDIGTTTLAMALVDLKTGEVVATRSRLNPQKSFGADVMSRISASSNGHLEELQNAIISAVKGMIGELVADHPEVKPKHMTVAGNPTMLHLFCGVSPAGMGTYPFTPAFTSQKSFAGSALSLPVEKVTVLPSASAFIGSDVLAGVLLTQMRALQQPSILIDVGTNGEMVLCRGEAQGGELIAASAAAGPAMEGAGLSCGIGGVSGAICAVAQKDGALALKTIRNQPPVGICSSGLIDLIALLLDLGELDETGYLKNESYPVSQAKDSEISLTQADVRAFQLAKSALRAGLEALLDESGLAFSDIGRIFLAGGLGYYMNCRSAARVGLFPAEVLNRVQAVGNSALGGAVQCLIDPKALPELAAIASNCRTVELNLSPTFNDAFIEQMLFPEA